jgi:UDP:flavonoid glycosyltransferase YjiC (YdhE family)
MVKHAGLVICNGGSPATQQALAEGVPVLGIARNMDQLLNMNFVVASGAGLRLRSDEVNIPRLRTHAEAILKNESFRAAASRLAADMRAYDAPARFAEILRAAASPWREEKCASRS